MTQTWTTARIRTRKTAYTYLGLQVKATREGADIKGFLDPSVLTTGQT